LRHYRRVPPLINYDKIHSRVEYAEPPEVSAESTGKLLSMSNMQAWDAERAQARIRELERLPGALLPILHALQEEFGYIDPQATPLIASALNLSRAEVHGVISFYHDFRHHPPGRHVLRICRAESCQSMGCDALVQHVEKRTGVKLGETTPDGSLTVEQVFCLGNCALSPAVMLDGAPYGRVSPNVADFLIDSAQRPQ
jgi:formate dehydrogenase subunit gamma